MNDVSVRLRDLLDSLPAHYRIVDHPAEGRTEVVSALRGHDVSEAAKCLIVIVKLGRRETRYVLAVVPGDKRLDLPGLRQLLQARYVAFASTDVAEELAGSGSGTILPFAFDSRLTLIADPSLLEHETLYFNAARLDQSIAMSARDWETLAQPRLERIASD